MNSFRSIQELSVADTDKVKTATFTLNLAQAAATYDVASASGDVALQSAQVFVGTVGATFTSVAIQTTNTTVDQIMSAVEGAVANVTGGKNLKVFTTLTVIPSGKKITFTLVGLTGTGSLTLVCRYQPLSQGAKLV